MKRAGLVVIVSIAALLLADAGLAAGRLSSSSHRSTRRSSSDEKEKTTKVVGNVRRVSSGNVRRSSSSSSSRTVHVVSSPKVSTSKSSSSSSSRTTRVVSSPKVTKSISHTSRISTPSRITRPSTTSRVPTTSRVIRPSSRITTTRPKVVASQRPRVSTGKSLVDATSTIERTDGGKFIVKPGNVRPSGGNIHFPGRLSGPTPSHKPEPKKGRHDGHGHKCDDGKPGYPGYPGWIIVDDDDWYDDDEPTVIVKVVEVPQIVYEPTPVIPQSPFIPREQISDAVVTAGLPLSRVEWERAEALIARGIIRNVLDQAGTGVDYDFELDANWARLNLEAPSEQVAVIETMIRDLRTFQAMTQPNRYGYSAAVIPVVSPFYLDSDPRSAAALAGENFDAIRDMLQQASWRYAYSGKSCWLNANYGTVTIIDERENINRAIALMNDLPFVPREMVHE